MNISVTSHETRGTNITYVNGRPIQREEVSTIYVVEPDESRPEISAERIGDATRELETVRLGRVMIWLLVWVGWAGWLWWSFG